MSRSLTAEETAALPPMPLGLPVDRPLTLREVVWTNAYGTAFAVDQRICWEAASPGPERDREALAMVNVKRCKAVADAAVERMEER